MEKIKYTFFAISIISNSGYVLMSTPYSKFLLLIPSLILLIYNIQYFYKSTVSKNLRSGLLAFSLFAIIIVIPQLFNLQSANITSLIRMLIVTAISINIVVLSDMAKLSDYYIKVSIFLYSISLILYGSINIFQLSFPSMVLYNVNNVSYDFLIFYSKFSNFMEFRNTSVYWEPGIYASSLFIIFSLSIVRKKNLSLKAFFIIISSMLTTFSAAGIIFIALMALIYSVERKFSKILIAGILIALVLVLANNTFVSGSIQILKGIDLTRILTKIIDPHSIDQSRTIGPGQLLAYFYASPFSGYGLAEVLNRYQDDNTSLVLTSTHAYLVASFGISAVFFISLPIIAILLSRNLKFLSKICMIAAYIFISNKEPIYNFLTYNILIAYSLIYIRQRLSNTLH